MSLCLALGQLILKSIENLAGTCNLYYNNLWRKTPSPGSPTVENLKESCNELHLNQ